MNFNLDVRLKQLESLEQYISSSRDKVQSILDCLKWSTREIVEESQLIKCSVDPSHRIPLKSADEHIKHCSLRKEGYDLNEVFLSEPLHDLNSSIMIDDHKKIEILSTAHQNVPDFKSGWNGQDPDPKTADRLFCTFSPHERTALYSYAVKNTVGPPELPEFNTVQASKTNDKPLSIEELRMQERDAKRRRIKYKSIHTNRKSHKEVLREVIDGQMELYMDWLVDNGLVESKLEEPCQCPTQPETNTKEEYNQDFNELQKSRHSSVSDIQERCNSVVSKNSTHSGSSKSTRNHKDKYDYDHYERHDEYERRKYNGKSYHNSYSRSSHKRRRSREYYDETRKYKRSHSRHSHGSRYDDLKIR